MAVRPNETNPIRFTKIIAASTAIIPKTPSYKKAIAATKIIKKAKIAPPVPKVSILSSILNLIESTWVKRSFKFLA